MNKSILSRPRWSRPRCRGLRSTLFRLFSWDRDQKCRYCFLGHISVAMDSRNAIASEFCDTELGPSQLEAEQNSSSSWLDLVDWTLLDADIWVDGNFGSISNGDFTEDYDFQGFDGQLVEAKATSTSSQHHSVFDQGNPGSGARSMEVTEFGLLDCPDSKSDNEVSEGGRVQESSYPGRGRSQRPELLLSGRSPAPRPSPSPRRRGRLSDLVRKGMEELKHAKGACWRCKILRKKVG